jgi:hypothetical protein
MHATRAGAVIDCRGLAAGSGRRLVPSTGHPFGAQAATTLDTRSRDTSGERGPPTLIAEPSATISRAPSTLASSEVPAWSGRHLVRAYARTLPVAPTRITLRLPRSRRRREINTSRL